MHRDFAWGDPESRRIPERGMKPSAAMRAAGEARAANAIVTFVTNPTFSRRRLCPFIPARAGTRFYRSVHFRLPFEEA
jgi:hypothetical protein